MIEPYAFIRTVTLGLALLWTAAAFLRIARFTARWKRRLAPLGLDDRWWRRRIATACLRATVLDPINLALLCFLIGSWTLPLGG